MPDDRYQAWHRAGFTDLDESEGSMQFLIEFLPIFMVWAGGFGIGFGVRGLIDL